MNVFKEGLGKMLCNKEGLLQNIEELRKELIEIADLKGMTDEKTIRLSQTLDCLLNKYEQLFGQ